VPYIPPAPFEGGRGDYSSKLGLLSSYGNKL